MQTRENWKDFTPEQVRFFLRTGVEDGDHASRLKVVRLLEGIGSLLDVGCGTGVMFELIRDVRPDVEYMGIDVTAQFIDAARERYPSDARRFLHASLLELRSLEQDFDVVVARHVLEHLPDYVPATQQMYERARRKLILAFYLPPRPLTSQRKDDERFEENFYTHTYDLGVFVHHLLQRTSPAPMELRIHPRQGYSDRSTLWGDRESVIYEIIRSD